MAVGLVDRQKLVNIADAVREKTGIIYDMTLDDIASNIISMPTANNNANFDFSRSGGPILPGSNSKLLPYLTKIDLSSWDTSNITEMNSMFKGCSSLTSLDLSNFDTSNVTSMSNMFYGCWKITSLDLSNFDTSKVTNMSNMFSVCPSLTSFELSNFDTSKVTNINSMFGN